MPVQILRNRVIPKQDHPERAMRLESVSYENNEPGIIRMKEKKTKEAK